MQIKTFMSTCTLTLVISIKLKLKGHQQMISIVMEWVKILNLHNGNVHLNDKRVTFSSRVTFHCFK